MASLLSDVLRCLCRESGWSYAVLWKISPRNPSLLVWEGAHYEFLRHSVPSSGNGEAVSKQILTKECNGLHNTPIENLDFQEHQDDGSGLVGRMMMSKVYMVGKGVVGRAFLMGDHQWILRDHGPIYENQAELLRQFSEGIQTIAVIPLLPHGVVQLGSVQMIMENLIFVSHVKNLFLQLASMPGALSYNDINKQLVQPMEMPFSFRKNLSADKCSESSLELATSNPFAGEELIEKFPLSISPTSRLSYQASCSSMTIAEPELRMKHHTASHASNSISIQPASAVKSNKWFQKSSLLEQKSPPCHDSNELAYDCQSVTSRNTKTSQLESHGSKDPGYHSASVVSLMGNGESWGIANENVTLNSCAWKSFHSIPCSHVDGIVQPDDEAGSILSCNRHEISAEPFPCFDSSGNFGIMVKQEAHKNVFEPLNGSSKSSNDQISLVQNLPTGFLEACSLKSPVSDEERRDGIFDKTGNLTDTNMSQPHKKLKGTSSKESVKFPPGYDFFDMLGSDFKIQQLHGWNDVVLHHLEENVGNMNAIFSSCLSQHDVCHFDQMDNMNESGIFFESGNDQLLDAVVSKVSSSNRQLPDGNLSCTSAFTEANSSSHDSSSHIGKAEPEKLLQKVYGHPQDLSALNVSGMSAVLTSTNLNNTIECPQIDNSSRSQINVLIKEARNIRSGSVSTAFSKMPNEVGKTIRKRTRSSENPRPRPKDRQMIQDRVKELREIVPNGAKCSIDALLERTIKHMVFLQSMTNHADKLKRNVELKIIGRKDDAMNDSLSFGKTLAVEISSRNTVYPIIVEDLNVPRHMLVEILCEQRSLFLEIADIIRGLGLTILKGVMEAHSDAVWARFIVEAKKDVTRMTVFMSLVHLLEQSKRQQPNAHRLWEHQCLT